MKETKITYPDPKIATLSVNDAVEFINGLGVLFDKSGKPETLDRQKFIRWYEAGKFRYYVNPVNGRKFFNKNDIKTGLELTVVEPVEQI